MPIPLLPTPHSAVPFFFFSFSCSVRLSNDCRPELEKEDLVALIHTESLVGYIYFFISPFPFVLLNMVPTSGNL